VLWFLAFALVGGGIAAVVSAFSHPVVDAVAVLSELDADLEADRYTEQLSEPLFARILMPIGRRVAMRVAGLLPSNLLEHTRHKLLVAGLLDRIRAEEFVVIRVVSTAGGFLVGLAASKVLGESGSVTFKAAVLMTFVGTALPLAWVRRHRDERVAAIKQDLPDVLDLLAISVEAGAGFEYAVDVATRHFDSPLARELARALREMELGLNRKDALQNLKRRTDVPELSNFVLTLIQADALGMPIGRVLHSQAAEMRSKRRQWAREKAGKLPVKIMFPLVLFIFPALLVVVLGPAASSIMKGL